MADKETALSISIRTVDRATAGIKAINKHLDELTRPRRELGKALSDLADKSGFNKVMDGFSGVGSAVGDLFGKVAMVGGAVVAAAFGVKALVDQFSLLGRTAKRAGVEADFLAGMRYAAEQSGASMEALDEGITTLTQNLGQMKAGTGRAFKFLSEHASPVLARQMIAAHGTAEAFGLLADAMAKLPDAERRAALAQKLLGSNELAPLAARGSKGIQELMGSYARLAGSQGEAVASATEFKHSLHDMEAATDGVKAALVVGLSPALTQVIHQTTEWLVDHREDIRAWANDVGGKLPGAIDKVVAAVKSAAGDVQKFVDDIGGWKVAAEGLALVLAGPLIGAVASLGVALVATPFGAVLLSLTAIVAAIAALTGETETFERVAERLGFTPKRKTDAQDFAERQDAMMEQGRRAAKSDAAAKAALDNDPAVQQMRLLQDQHDAMLAFPDDRAAFIRAKNAELEGARTEHESRMAQLNAQIAQFQAQHPGSQEINVKVDISGAPRGTRVTADAKGATVDLTTGHQLIGAP